MGLSHSPSIVTNGLVFAYDMANTKKSWKGKPLTNYYGDISTSASLRPNSTSHYWDGNQWIVDSTYTHPGVSGPIGVFLGLVYKHTSGALNSTWSGNSYGYVLKDIASTSGSRYTMSSWVYMSGDCNISAIPSTTEGATTNNISVTGFSTSYNTSNKDTWQQLAVGAISDGNVRWIPNYPNRAGVTDGSFTGFYMWGGVQVEDGDIVNRYSGSNEGYARSNAQALVDLTGQNTITANSLTYASDGTFSFNGSNYLTVAGMSNYNFGSNFTVLIWNKNIGGDYRGVVANTYGGGGFDLRYGREDYYGGANNGTILNCYLQTSGGTFSSSIFSDLQKYGHYGYTYNGTNLITYKNGNQWSSTSANGTISVTSNPIIIGRNLGNFEYLTGELPVVQIYNRALSAAEVKQNFNALRGRYGL